MLLHLILHLMNQKRRQNAASTAVEQHRKQEVGPIVIDCPLCGTTGLSMHYQIMESSNVPGEPWKKANEIFQCSYCSETLEADAFENDGHGVMRARAWVCTDCKTPCPSFSKASASSVSLQ